MKKVLFIFLIFNIFSACKESEDAQPDITSTLTAETWKGDEAKSEIVGSPSTLSFFSLANIPTDSTVKLSGSRITFQEDKTFTASGLSDLVAEDGDINGTWEFLENNTKIRLQGLNINIKPPAGFEGLFELPFPEVWTIKSLTSTSLVLTNTTETTISKETLETLLPPELIIFAQDLDIVVDLEVVYFR